MKEEVKSVYFESSDVKIKLTSFEEVQKILQHHIIDFWNAATQRK
ncbi:hypothetical protein [Bacillus sp. FSL K6-3431]